MASAKVPTLRARWLAKTMREHRLEAGVQVNEIVELLKRHRSTFAKFETGEIPIPGNELLLMLDSYQVSDLSERARILNLAEQVTQRGWWDGFNFSSGLANYVWLESAAQTIQIFALTAMPGLIQNPDFAHALISNSQLKDDATQVNRGLEARSMRAQILQKKDAPQIELVLYEPILGQAVGGPQVLAAQIQYLMDLVEDQDLSIRILPANDWHHLAWDINASFSLFTLPDQWPDVLAIETPLGVSYRESPDIALFTRAFGSFWDEYSLDDEASKKCLDSYLKEVTDS